MELAHVLGSVTATAKTESLLSHPLLVVQPFDPAGSNAKTAEVRLTRSAPDPAIRADRARFRRPAAAGVACGRH
jgi:hypothetical protein